MALGIEVEPRGAQHGTSGLGEPLVSESKKGGQGQASARRVSPQEQGLGGRPFVEEGLHCGTGVVQCCGKGVLGSQAIVEADHPDPCHPRDPAEIGKGIRGVSNDIASSVKVEPSGREPLRRDQPEGVSSGERCLIGVEIPRQRSTGKRQELLLLGTAPTLELFEEGANGLHRDGLSPGPGGSR
jgi:hypothetical protein